MKKTILITGSTDGIGLEGAKLLIAQGHHIILHGRNPEKLNKVVATFSERPDMEKVDSFVADLSVLSQVEQLSKDISEKYNKIDVLINNAGVYGPPKTMTEEGLSTGFVVNCIAPYLLTQRLLSKLSSKGRVINVSSAAQAPVNLEALAGQTQISESSVYAQSKLAMIMWTRHLAMQEENKEHAIVSLNPGSMLGTKMVQESFGVAGADIGIGARIIVQSAISTEFENATGQYYCNDSGQFAPPHRDALDPKKCEAIVKVMDQILTRV